MKLTVKHDGVWLDEQKIQNCTQIDIKNISPINRMEVVLHVHVDEADVRWNPLMYQRKSKRQHW